MKKFSAILIIIVSLTLNSCGIFRITVSNVENTLFNSPQKVVNKVKNPVQDGVKLSALWIGHSSMLVQIYDKVILLDPFLTNTMGGIFTRRKEAGLDLKDLSKLDMVLVSHTHMDHLSFGSLDMIADKFPGRPLVFPKGGEYYMPDFDLNLIRLDNTKSQSGQFAGTAIYVDSVRITPVYAHHSGGRYAFDTYSWRTEGATGYIIEYKDVCVYFAGDTGYQNEAFKKIGNTFKIDLALIPIGPCRNCDSTGFWHHTSSVEALWTFEDLKASYMIPMHYGAIEYVRDAYYPSKALERMLNDKDEFKALKDRVKILKEGEQIIWRKTENGISP
jgi:L-ascorbate metabolism protein UlaG (beta-lactamase superfamily)